VKQSFIRASISERGWEFVDWISKEPNAEGICIDCVRALGQVLKDNPDLSNEDIKNRVKLIREKEIQHHAYG